MSDIAIEILALLLLASVIGWFLGRSLTKNNEVEERSNNRQLSKQIETLQNELTHTQQMLTESQAKTNVSTKHASELEQKQNNLKARQQSLQDERKALLTELQNLEVSHSRLEKVETEYHAQTQSLQALNTQYLEQESVVVKLQSELKLSDQQLETYTEQTRNQLKQLTEAHEENGKQASYILELEKDRQALRLLKLDHDEALSRCQMLEEDKASLHERHQELRSEHQELRLQCDGLRSDTLKFNDRFSELMNEKEALVQTIETLNIEKNDYLGRLRAISGVIDVVGTEKLSSDTSNQEYIPRQPVIIK